MSNEDTAAGRHKTLVRDWFRMFSIRDPAEAARLASEVAADLYIEHAIAPFGQAAPGPVEGPRHLVEASAWLVAQFPDIEMSVEAMVVEDDLVAARVRSTGTNLGPLNGIIPSTGRSFDAHQSHWFRIRDGRIAEHWATRDDLRAMLELGVITRPGGERPGLPGAASTTDHR
ncbi:MAG TPA: ester cyclase [Candidatus Limnocylindrales bacterium]|jgi:predicted ester cyclase|nr:ester cyclase [Candidatus Limnocylindrales bacterium]